MESTLFSHSPSQIPFPRSSSFDSLRLWQGIVGVLQEIYLLRMEGGGGGGAVARAMRKTLASFVNSKI